MRNPKYERVESTVRTDVLTIQRARDYGADALRRRLDLPVADMGVTKSHARAPVSEQARDHRQWDALENSVAGEAGSKVVESHVLDSGFPALQVPERQVGRERSPRVERRRRDVTAPGQRLLPQNSARLRTEDNRSWPGLGIGQIDGGEHPSDLDVAGQVLGRVHGGQVGMLQMAKLRQLPGGVRTR